MAPKKTTASATAADKTRPTRAAAAPAATATASASKPNTKKRAAAAAVDEVPSKKATRSKKANIAAAAAAVPEEQDATDVNEREIIASLSDVSADSSDSSDIEELDEANSSDEDDEDDEDDRLAQTTTQPRSSLASVKLPNSKDDAVVKARLDKLRKTKPTSSTTTPGVLYIGRLPKGFFEKQLKSYFSQFGDVTRLRVSRNKKTGASKHYAFVEFADRDVAKIVEETMHNYLIDGRLLQVKEVSKDKVHPELWVGANQKFNRVPGDRIERVVRGREKTEEQQRTSNQRLMDRQQKRREKLEKLGIEYEFEGYTQEGEGKKESKVKATPVKKSTKGKTAKA